MDWLSTILTSKNGVPILVFALIVLITVLIALKAGIITFNGKGLSVGIQTAERTVMQRQTTFVHAQMDAIANKFNIEHPEFDDYKTKWICKCAELEWIRSIHYNHIEDSDGYRDDRFTALLALVQKKADNKYFFTKQFEEFLRKHVEQTVTKLVQIRKLKGV